MMSQDAGFTFLNMPVKRCHVLFKDVVSSQCYFSWGDFLEVFFHTNSLSFKVDYHYLRCFACNDFEYTAQLELSKSGATRRQ